MAKDNPSESYILQQALPQDRETERSVIGTIINNDGIYSSVEDILDGDAFYDTRMRAVFRCVKYLTVNGKVIDTNAILDVAKRHMKEFGFELTELDIMEVAVCDSKETFLQDVERIVEFGQRRKAWEVFAKGAQGVLVLTDNVEDAITLTVRSAEAVRDSVKVTDGVVDAKQGLAMVMAQINDNLSGINKSTVKTGFHFSDDKGGLRLGALVVLGAFTSVGKSTLAMNISVNVAGAGIPVAYYSLEMSAAELWSRVLNSTTGIPAWKIQGYALNRDEYREIEEASKRISGIPLIIDDKATTSFQKMKRSVRKLVKTHGIKVFVVDYLQIFAQNSRSDREEAVLSSMARECKNLCRELNIICILLSQLRRAGEDKHPAFDMLRGSGQIEESADNIVLIDRPEAHPEWGVMSFKHDKTRSVHNTAELMVVKGRNIGTGSYFVGFDPQRFVFYEEDGYCIGDAAAPKAAENNDMPFSAPEGDDKPF